MIDAKDILRYSVEELMGFAIKRDQEWAPTIAAKLTAALNHLAWSTNWPGHEDFTIQLCGIKSMGAVFEAGQRSAATLPGRSCIKIRVIMSKDVNGDYIYIPGRSMLAYASKDRSTYWLYSQMPGNSEYVTRETNWQLYEMLPVITQ